MNDNHNDSVDDRDHRDTEQVPGTPSPAADETSVLPTAGDTSTFPATTDTTAFPAARETTVLPTTPEALPTTPDTPEARDTPELRETTELRASGERAAALCIRDRPHGKRELFRGRRNRRRALEHRLREAT